MKIVKPDQNGLNEAIKALNSGKVIIFPTETVYGIGALASNEKAVKRIFKIKNRSYDKPLQILISDKKQIDIFTSEVTEKARVLMKKYWPGPLTLVFKKKPEVSNLITSGGNTIGLRMPDNKTILKLITATGPLAASSANISGEPDPRSISDIKIDADLILDGGKCKLGQASTVVDVSVDPPLILREGKIIPF